MRRFKTTKGLIGITLLLLIALIAIVGPMVIPPDAATKMDMLARRSPPTWTHLLGTDQLGRDMLFRVILGARTSLEIAVSAVLMSIVLGYFGGWIDNVLMRLVDTLLAFPALLLALTISAVLGPNVQNTIIAIGVAFTPYLARIIRGEALKVAQMPYVEAARASGTTDGMIMLRHVLPNILPAVIVQATISLAFAILAEAGLSFLGLGTQPPAASWGLMIQASRDQLDVAPGPPSSPARRWR
jgi:peptide/nickel transport system permease protein